MSGTTVVSDKTAAIKAALKALVQDRVLVGIPSEHAFRQPEPGDENPELNNAEIGYLNEFGAPEINLPARPHLVPGVAKVAKDKVPELYRKAAVNVLDGNTAAIKAAHGQVGFVATSSVKNFITDGISPALADSTIAKRQARGRTGTTPLLDTGQYRRSIDYVVRPAGQVKKKGRS